MSDAEKNPSCLFLLDSLGIGGSERKTIAAANLLAERGYNIHLAFLNLKHDLGNTINPAIGTINLDCSSKVDMAAIKKLRHYIEKHSISVIWSVNLYPMFYAYLSTRNNKAIRVFGSSNVSLFRNKYEKLKMFIYVPIIWHLDGFIFGSTHQMREWKKKYPLGDGMQTVVHNGVDIGRFSRQGMNIDRLEAKRSFGIPVDNIVFGMVAQFRVEKAHQDLIAAAKNLCDQGVKLSLLLVGDGNTMNQIKTLVHHQGMEGIVVFTGLLEDVRPALNAMDAFALTSRAVETFSNAALEAMSMQLPVVLSDLAGAREMVDEGCNGYLYPPGDIGQLTSCMNKFLDAKSRRQMANNARELVKNRFSSSSMVDSYERIICGGTD